MPRLDALFRAGLGYATLLNHNRRTNRGLYALLCGELPNLIRGDPKMTVAAVQPWQRCLPEVLREAGYRTVYLQAAPLAFMLKDQFMPKAGFERVHGHKWFERHYLRTAWGVDDRAFFEEAARMIEALRDEGDPWFLTLLTVGTHHPYVVPAPYRAPGSRQSGRGAYRYLDRALGEFAQRIEELGIREDTLILFVSDESAGLWPGTSDPVAARLTQQWGFLAALLPERPRALVSDAYAQSDLALSVLDYLGLVDAGSHFIGRSLFRRYDGGRHLLFGNVNFRSIGVVSPEGLLVVCQSEGRSCAAYDTFSGRLFADGLSELPPAPELEALLREAVVRNQPPAQDEDLELPLLADGVFSVDRREWQLVQGVSQIALEPDEWLEVEFEVVARGSGRAELKHYLRMPRRRNLFFTEAALSGGQRLRVRYTLTSDVPIGQMTCRSEARLTDGWKLDLVYQRQGFAVRRGGVRPAPGIQLEILELEPADARGSAPLRAVMAREEIERHARSQWLERDDAPEAVDSP